jgi:outer membrane protein
VSRIGVWRTAIIAGALVLVASPGVAQTLADALAQAYANNPTLNAARASLRATDEGVPQALSGYRPTVSGSGSASYNRTNAVTTWPRSVAITIEQPIFLGFRTKNSLKAAETAVLAGRESLRSVEQDPLLAAATAFMDLVQAQALLNLTTQNLEFLREQVRAAQDRLDVGEGTRTDVAQTESALAAGQSEYNAAVAQLNTAVAVYEEIIGSRPNSLGTASTVEPLLPQTLEVAIATGQARHPSILASSYNVDVAAFNVSIAEGSLLPSVSVEGSLSRSDGTLSGPTNTASIVGRASVPLYSGGLTSSEVREAKETLGQRRNELDAARAAVQRAVISAWGSLNAARGQITAANAQVTAQQLALAGVTEERNVGQRTTLDVLNAQQDLLDAREAQVNAQHDRVVASYSLLSAVGKLNVDVLNLKVQRYDPTNHYGAVRDKWHGLRTPDGR